MLRSGCESLQCRAQMLLQVVASQSTYSGCGLHHATMHACVLIRETHLRRVRVRPPPMLHEHQLAMFVLLPARSLQLFEQS